MLKHLILTAFTAVIVVSLIVMAMGTPDPPTAASADEYLKLRKLDASLTPVWKPTEAGDSGTIYRKAFDVFVSNRAALDSKAPPARVVKQLRDLLVQAANRSEVVDGFADDSVPMEPGATPEWGHAPLRMSDLICRAAGDEPKDEARKTIVGVWALGQRLFQNNLRLFPRRNGIGAMQTAEMAARSVLGDDSDLAKAMKPWVQQVDRINDAWRNKMDGVFGYEPSVGDVLRVAELDQDRTFRVEAVLQMGVVRWTKANNRGDLRAIRNALAGYMQDRDPLIADAAKAANAMTREQVRQLH